VNQPCAFFYFETELNDGRKKSQNVNHSGYERILPQIPVNCRLPRAGYGRVWISTHLVENRFVLAYLEPRGDLSNAQERALIFADPVSRRDCRAGLDITTPIPRLSRAEAWALLNCIFEKLGVTRDG
jgi:hypothetical protein